MDDNAEINKQAKIMDDILAEDRTLKYDFMTSLQNIITAKIISNLWMNRNTQNEIVNLFRSHVETEQHGFPEKWLQIQSKIVSQVSELFLPTALIERLRNIVPVIGHSLLNWIRYHDEYVMKSWQNSKYSAVDFTSHITWTARGKVDYAQTAKNILANDTTLLNDVQKYEIACCYCFLDKISLLSLTIDDRYYFSDICMKGNPMVYFWTAHIKRNDKLYNPYHTLFLNTYRDMSIYQHLLWLLTNNDGSVKQTLNEIPIIYVWNKLNKDERAKCITPLLKKIGSQDFVYSLLSNLSYEQQQGVFKECSDSILVGILNDWLWEDYFLPTAFQILDIMNPLFYLNVLKEVNKKKNNSEEENDYLKFKSIFKQLWEKGSGSLKDFIYEHEYGNSLAYLVTISLSFERDLDVIELILKDLTSQQKRKITLEWHGINCCSLLIQNDRWDLLEQFINHTLSCDEDVTQLKQKLSKEAGYKIALHFLDHKALDKIEYFLNWTFNSEEEKNKFRQNVAFISNIYLVTIQSIKSSDKVDVTDLENHFQWCAKNDPEVLKKLKEKVPKYPAGRLLIVELMKQQKYELVDQVLSWCFSGNEKQIACYKSNMYTSLQK